MLRKSENIPFQSWYLEARRKNSHPVYVLFVCVYVSVRSVCEVRVCSDWYVCVYISVQTRLLGAPVLLADFCFHPHEVTAPNLRCPRAWTVASPALETVGPHVSQSREPPSCSAHCWVVKVPALCSSPGLYCSRSRRPVMSG